jgi:enoyl-CoA hydratase
MHRSCDRHGEFLLLSGDYRIGVEGPYRVVANEVAIGLTMPRAAIEICRLRLAPAHFQRAVLLAETYTPSDGVAAGFLDRVVPDTALGPSAISLAE